jgi:hypothetical protein
MIDRRVLLLGLVACVQSHDDKRVSVRGEDCVTCHRVDFDTTQAPPHAAVPSVTGAVAFPTTCADCHRTSSWQPALGGLHPSPHNLELGSTSVAGANTNCVQCHPDDTEQRDSHKGVRGPTGQAYAYAPAVQNFCLSCHPQGLAKKHPDTEFPRTGPHATPCDSCHDRASGLPDMDGLNTTCINSGCHTLSKEDSNHRDEGTRYTQARGDGSNRHFCLASGCHPDGRKND